MADQGGWIIKHPFEMVGSGGSWSKVGNYNLELIERAQINGEMQS